jgi:uncharacterized protein YoxC
LKKDVGTFLQIHLEHKLRESVTQVLEQHHSLTDMIHTSTGVIYKELSDALSLKEQVFSDDLSQKQKVLSSLQHELDDLTKSIDALSSTLQRVMQQEDPCSSCTLKEIDLTNTGYVSLLDEKAVVLDQFSGPFLHGNRNWMEQWLGISSYFNGPPTGPFVFTESTGSVAVQLSHSVTPEYFCVSYKEGPFGVPRSVGLWGRNSSHSESWTRLCSMVVSSTQCLKLDLKAKDSSWDQFQLTTTSSKHNDKDNDQMSWNMYSLHYNTLR